MKDDDSYVQETRRAYTASAFEGMKAQLALFSAALAGLATQFDNAISVQNFGRFWLLPASLLVLSACLFCFSLVTVVLNFSRTTAVYKLVLRLGSKHPDVAAMTARGVRYRTAAEWTAATAFAIGLVVLVCIWTDKVIRISKDREQAMNNKSTCSQSSESPPVKRFLEPIPQPSAATPPQQPSTPPAEKPPASQPQK